MTYNTIKLTLGLFATVCVGVLLTGCDSNSANSSNDDAKTSGLPKLKFHQPKTYSDAVVRLREIQDVLIGEDELPSPKQFKVLEIIHGEGAAAHSHYHLAPGSEGAENEDHEHDDHGHEDMKTEEKTHDVEIDIFTEYDDIVRWLPIIAANSDMPEATWNTVKDVSVALEECLEGILDGTEDAKEKRAGIKAKHDKIDGFLKQLEQHNSAS